MVEQYDFWGNEVKPNEPIKRGRKKYIPMQELYVIKEGKTCKTCKYCIGWYYHGRTYYKCELWIKSNSSATDIRLKNKACNKWEADNG